MLGKIKPLIWLLSFLLMFCFSVPVFATGTLNFDGTQSQWAEKELQEAYSYGLTYSQVEQNYQNPITREEFCVIAVKLYEKLGGAAPVLGSNPFTDTTNPEILKAYALGIVKGTSTTTFSPKNNITRQEICVMILRALQSAKPSLNTTPGSDFPFNDAGKVASWAIDAMKFCYQNDIMKGTGPGTISPLNNTNREQAIVLLKRTFTKYSGNTEPPVVQIKPGNVNNLYSVLDSMKSPQDPGFGKNKIYPRIPANDSSFLSSAEASSGNSSGITLPGTGVTIKPGAGSSVSPKPGTAASLGARPRVGTDGLHVMTPEEITDYWENQYDNGQYGDYVPSGFPLKPHESGLSGVGYLGKGYDVVTGKFADPSEGMKDYVLSISKLLNDQRIYKNEEDYNNSRYKEGSSAKSYSQALATSVGVSGGYLYFSGSVKTNFSTSTLTETNRKFATLIYDASKYGVYFDDRNLNFQNYLDSAFKHVINDPQVDPFEIFAMYGTHVVRYVRMGGRLDYNATSNSTYNSETHNFEADVKASFNAGFASAGVHYQTSQTRASESFEQNCETEIFAYPAYGGSHRLEPSAFNAWFNRVQTNPGLADFGKNRPLIPIWKMAVNPMRREQIKAAFERYAAKHQYIPADTVYCINGLRLNPQPVGSTLAGLDDNTIEDPVTHETWELVSNLSPHMMLPGDIQQQLYVRKGMSDIEAKPPVVAVFLVNESQGENAKAIFKRYWGDDPTARLWGDGGEAKSDPSLKSYISSLPVGQKLKLYYVTSKNQRPITKLRVKHLGNDGQLHYFPKSTENDDSFVSVWDLGSHMNGQFKPQDCAEGTPDNYGILDIHKNIILQYSYE
ncbi:MAG: S-layer homology domain-containing protein [Bacillota bacterium]